MHSTRDAADDDRDLSDGAGGDAADHLPLSDYNEPRRIFTDGRASPELERGDLHGYSIGRWVDTDGDGRYDALEVETRGLKGPRNFDNSGIPLHKDQQTIIKERITSTPPITMCSHQITTIDHALTEPWTVPKTYERDRNPIWSSGLLGGHPPRVDRRRRLLHQRRGPADADQEGESAPDLRYFKPAGR